jgi:deoxyribodipyrimidine photo-lyase
MPAVMWFRRDLRLMDNPAWSAATRSDHVVPLFVIQPGLWSSAGAFRRAQLRAHLSALDEGLRVRGGRLMVVEGDPRDVVPTVAARFDAATVHINDDHTPFGVARDTAVGERVGLERHDGVTLHPPEAITTSSGNWPKVFTPYYERWRELPWDLWPEEADVDIATEPGGGPPDAPEPPMPGGSEAALDRLEQFVARVDDYAADRDHPDRDGTSRLSADLHFGTLDARRIRDLVGEDTPGRAAFVRQLCWRDFHIQVMRHHPAAVEAPLRGQYARIRWRNDAREIDAWKDGRTGYPLVDAGMRQLRTEGWIHNRVRMVVASFLVKDLLVDWRIGERWFRHHLVDGDTAQNVGNWQWVAGTGTDAAPYFRVFNPVTQSRRFDPEGAYIRRHVSELAELRPPGVHAPWEAGPLELEAAGVVLGETYPEPIVDHAAARQRVLDAYREAREAAAPDG